MKHHLLLLTFLALGGIQTVWAGSSNEGGEKHGNKEVQYPGNQAELGEMGPGSGIALEDMEIVLQVQDSGGEDSLRPVGSEVGNTSEVSRPQSNLDPRFRRVATERNGDADGNIVFGIMSIFFGLMGIFFAVCLLALFALWPMVLMFSAIAVALGAIGIIRKGKGREMALSGLILGMIVFAPLTIGIIVYVIIHWKDGIQFF